MVDKLKQLRAETLIKIAGVALTVLMGFISYQLLPVRHSIELLQKDVSILRERFEENKVLWDVHLQNREIHPQATDFVRRQEINNKLAHLKELIILNRVSLEKIEKLVQSNPQ